jgi:hypothetical protein
MEKQAEKLTFRLWTPYSEKVLEKAVTLGMSPNQFGRLATIAMADHGFLEVRERMARMEEELIRLRRDFNNAVRNGE